jgi:protein required for attachment to host cells
MNEHRATWIAIADDHALRLLRGWASGAGRTTRLRLELIDELENPWSALEQPPGPQEVPELGSERLLRLTEFRQRYASEIARWLRESVHQHEIDELQLFAPPRLTVMLRRELDPDLAAIVEEHRVDVGSLRLERLERSPELVDLFSAAS